MRLSFIALIVSTMVLTACGGLRDSRINPANWFGGSTSTEVETVTNEEGEVVEVNPLIGARRQSQLNAANKPKASNQEGFSLFGKKKEAPYQGTLVDQVTSLEIKRTSTGAIVNVTGVSARQGAFDVRLIPANQGVPIDGVLTYELRALQPISTAQGPERTRRITTAAPLTVGQLEEIRTVQVVARRNVRTSRR